MLILTSGPYIETRNGSIMDYNITQNRYTRRNCELTNFGLVGAQGHKLITFFYQEKNEKKDVKICESNPIPWTINPHNPLHDFFTPEEPGK